MKYFLPFVIVLAVVFSLIILNVIRKHILFILRLRNFLRKTGAELLVSKRFWWIAAVRESAPNFSLVYADRVFAIKIIGDSFFPIHNTIVFLTNLKYTMVRRFLDRKSSYRLDFRLPDKYPYDLSATGWRVQIPMEHYRKELHCVALFFPAKKQIYILEDGRMRRIHDGSTINDILFCGTTSLFSAIRSLL